MKKTEVNTLEKMNNYRGFQSYIFIDGLMLFFVVKNRFSWRSGSRSFTYPNLLEMLSDLLLETGKKPIVKPRFKCKYRAHKIAIALIESL